MLFNNWKKDAKERLKKLPTQELIAMSNSNEPDAKKLADEILFDRRNFPKRGIAVTDEDWGV